MRAVRPTLGLIGAVLLVVGCSSGDDDGADVTTSSTTTVAERWRPIPPAPVLPSF